MMKKQAEIKVKMNQKLFEGCSWHQRWEITPGVFTPGTNDVALLLSGVELPADLSGKRVLDIGAWNGCFSFECERRGASEVLAIGPEDPEVTGFNRLRDYLNSKVAFRFGSVYNLDPNVYGHFDAVLFFGVFYHLRYPLLALDNIRRVARGELYFESSFIDQDTLIDGTRHSLRELNPLLERTALLQFYRGNEFNGDPSNWFSPNTAAVRDMLLSSGFTPIKIAPHGVRIHAKAVVEPGWPEFLRIDCGENVYYQLFMTNLTGSKSDFLKQ